MLHAPSLPSTNATLFRRVVVFPFVLLSALVWAVIGPFFWIPLIVRASFAFSSGLLVDAILRSHRGRPSSHLESAISMYADGFFIVFRALFDPVEPPPQLPALKRAELRLPAAPSRFEMALVWRQLGIQLGILLWEFAKAAMVWLALYFVLSWTGILAKLLGS